MNGTIMKETRGLQIRVSLELLLDWMGLDHGQIKLGAVGLDVNMPDVLVLVLRGDDSRLPVVEEGNCWPQGTIIGERDETRSGVRGRVQIQ